MIRRRPRSPRTDTLFPYTTLFRSRSNSDLALFTSGVKTWLIACLHRSRLPPHDGFVRLRSGSRHQHAELQEPPARQPTGSAQLRSSCRLRSEEHTSELQSLMRISYAVFCLKKKKQQKNHK